MAKLRIKPGNLLLQALSYTVFMVVVWYLSVAPVVQPIGEDQSMVVVAFKHAGQTREKCRKATTAEMGNQAANMRMLTICPRERSPILLEVLMDGDILFTRTENPPGLYADGSVNLYLSTKVLAGKHSFAVRMNDSVRDPEYRYTYAKEVLLKPSQIIVISFNSEHGFAIK